jgi:hypothetical protein
MGVVDRFRELTEVLEELDDADGNVVDVHLAGQEARDGDGLTAGVTIAFDVAGALGDTESLRLSSPDAGSLDGGQLRVDFDVTLAAELDGSAVEPTATPPRTDGAGDVSHIPGARLDVPGSGVSEPAAPTAECSTDESAVETDTAGDATPAGGAESEGDGDAETDADDSVETESGVPATSAGEDAETDAADDDSEPTDAPDAPSADVGETEDAASTVDDAASADTDDETAGAADVPPHRNPDRLREVYDPDATFREMTEALGVDVTPQAVRNQMIQHGVHEPKSYGIAGYSLSESDDAAADATTDGGSEPSESSHQSVDDQRDRESDGRDADGGVRSTDSTERPADSPADGRRESETVDDDGAADPETDAEATGESESDAPVEGDSEADDAAEAEDADADAETETAVDEAREDEPDAATTDLPERPPGYEHLDVTVAEVCDAVHDARTLYEVERTLDLDRETVRGLLSDLDLIDLVTGRMATCDHRAASPAEIRNRAQDALGA